VVTVSLEAGEGLFGTLNLVAIEAGAFTDDDVHAVQHLGEELSLALRQVLLRTELTTERARLEALVEHLPEGVLLLDRGRRVALSNPVAREALADVGKFEPDGALETIGSVQLTELLDSAEEGRIHEVVSEHPVERVFELRSRSLGREDGTEWVVVLREVTAERKAKRQLQIQERLAAVGQLAAGIAHDFNNMLQAVMLHAELALKILPGQSTANRRVDAILQQSRQGAILIRQILDFARKTVSQPQPLELAPFLKESVRLLSSTIPETIRIGLEVGSEELRVVADPAQMQQLITNLATNAADAMPEGGELNIVLESTDVSSGELPVPDMAPGRWVRLRVTDTGCGMPAHVLERVFEPFFTTREPGQGTGLGLAQVYGIVMQHGGHVGVDSEEGAGSNFDVYLPTAPADVVDSGSWPAQTEVVPGSGELVMIVEDDPAILDVAREGVRDLGYRVVTASDGVEALELHDALGEEVVLVVSDMVMPDVGGLELARRLRDRGARSKVLLMTGYPLERDAGGRLTEGIVDWLQKPFTMDRLAAAITRVLAREEEG